jgi:nucleotide-binding universal stress UspA family protein
MLIRPQNSAHIAKKQRLITNILIPLDGSGLSKQALPVGRELATKLKIPITLFQMAHFIYPYGGDVSPFADHEKLNEAEEYKVSAEITALEKELKEQGFDVRSKVTSGTDAAREIIDNTKVLGSDLIIMSTHGRSGLERWVMGSVAEKILRYGETNLLLINAGAG